MIKASIRDSFDDDGLKVQDIECWMDDGQKFAAIQVDSDYPNLARFIADALNEASRIRDFEKEKDDRIKRQSQLIWDKFPEVKISRAYYEGDSLSLCAKFIPDDLKDEFFELMYKGAFFLKDEYSAPIVMLTESEMKEFYLEEYEEWKIRP